MKTILLIFACFLSTSRASEYGKIEGISAEIENTLSGDVAEISNSLEKIQSKFGNKNFKIALIFTFEYEQKKIIKKHMLNILNYAPNFVEIVFQSIKIAEKSIFKEIYKELLSENPELKSRIPHIKIEKSVVKNSNKPEIKSCTRVSNEFLCQ